jgi:hypothetical protein
VAFAFSTSSAVVNAIIPFIKPAQVDGAKEHIPGPGGERLEPHGQGGQNVRDVHPVLVSPNAAVGRDAPHLEVLGVRDRSEPRDRQPVGRSIEDCRAPLAEGFVRPLLVEGMPEGIEPPLLRRQ